MNQETPPQTEPAISKESLVDFVEGVDENNPLYLEVSITDDNRVIVFHDKPFAKALSWYEFDLAKSRLDFIFDDGASREIGMSLDPKIAAYMQNAHQILTVLMDDDSGNANEGHYFPLIIHRE